MRSVCVMIVRAVTVAMMSLLPLRVFAYEVAVGLGSTASQSATAAMGDISQWPMVAELSWGPLANLYPIGLLPRNQSEAVFNNFTQRRAITELPYPSIHWNESQPDISFIESFGLAVPYVFVIDGTAGDSMLTREELERVKARFPDKKIIMNAHSWVDDGAHVQAVQDVLDGVSIEYIPHNSPYNIARHVAPFAEWAHTNDKILMFLMPPLPDDYLEDRFVRYVKQLAQIVHDENSSRLPQGWMKSSRYIFAPSNYTFGESRLSYVPEDAPNTVLAAARALLLMRPQLDAGPVWPRADNSWLNSILLLLDD